MSIFDTWHYSWAGATPVKYEYDIQYPDSKVHADNMGPTWVLSAPDGPHAGPMNLAIRVGIQCLDNSEKVGT